MIRTYFGPRKRLATKRIGRTAVLAVAAAFLLVPLLAVLPGSAQTAGGVGGRVVTQGSQPAVGVQADLFEAQNAWQRGAFVASTSTDSTGRYSFNGSNPCYIVVLIAPDGSEWGNSGSGRQFDQRYVCQDGRQNVNAILYGVAPTPTPPPTTPPPTTPPPTTPPPTTPPPTTPPPTTPPTPTPGPAPTCTSLTIGLVQLIFYRNLPAGSLMTVDLTGFPRLVGLGGVGGGVSIDQFRVVGSAQRTYRLNPEVASTVFNVDLPNGNRIPCGSYAGTPTSQCSSGTDGLTQIINYADLPEGSVLEIGIAGFPRLVDPFSAVGGGVSQEEVALSGSGSTPRTFQTGVSASFNVRLPDGNRIDCGDFAGIANPQCVSATQGLTQVIQWQGIPAGSILAESGTGFPALRDPFSGVGGGVFANEESIAGDGRTTKTYGANVASVVFTVRLPDGGTVDCGAYAGTTPAQCVSATQGGGQFIRYVDVPAGSQLNVGFGGFSRLVGVGAVVSGGIGRDERPVSGADSLTFPLPAGTASASFELQLPDGTTVPCGTFTGVAPPPRCLSGPSLDPSLFARSISYIRVPDGSSLVQRIGGSESLSPASGLDTVTIVIPADVGVSFAIRLPDGSEIGCPST